MWMIDSFLFVSNKILTEMEIVKRREKLVKVDPNQKSGNQGSLESELQVYWAAGHWAAEDHPNSEYFTFLPR